LSCKNAARETSSPKKKQAMWSGDIRNLGCSGLWKANFHMLSQKLAGVAVVAKEIDIVLAYNGSAVQSCLVICETP
jgi:hypothetical protein